MTRLDLNAQEAEQFREWREHQDLFKKLLDLGVFGVRNGSAELHFDNLGNLSNAKLHFTVFQKVMHNPIAVIKETVVKSDL